MPTPQHRRGALPDSDFEDPIRRYRSTAMDGVPAMKGRAANSRRAVVLRVAGIVLAVLAVGLCVRTLIVEWSTIGPALAGADPWPLVVAVVSGGVGLWFLALQWWSAMRVFGGRSALGRATGWFFAGELGKYLPGGVWPVLGRGELAHRGGVSRSVAYVTTLVCLGMMCVGAAMACVLIGPLAIAGTAAPGPALWILALIPLGLLAIHPRIFGWVLGLLERMTGGRVALQAPPWSRMIGLIAVSVPTWLFIGLASALTTASLGFEQQPARVALAAVVAWIVGVLVVPVPAGAGIRELVFAAACGLPFGQAIAVAAVSRLCYIGFDLVAGVTSLVLLRRGRNRAPETAGRSDQEPHERSAKLAEQN
jgi:uncharacterized membrane protein YbhN (UPF0104 family)